MLVVNHASTLKEVLKTTGLSKVVSKDSETAAKIYSADESLLVACAVLHLSVLVCVQILVV